MDVILHQLSELLLKAIPTFLLVVFLHFYLKAIFFKPLEKVLHKRHEATEGARKLAAESLDRAAAKTTEYENKLRVARTDIYRMLEQLHKLMAEKHSAQLAEAREHAEAAIKDAKSQIAAETETAKATLQSESERLANQIVESILRRNAA